MHNFEQRMKVMGRLKEGWLAPNAKAEDIVAVPSKLEGRTVLTKVEVFVVKWMVAQGVACCLGESGGARIGGGDKVSSNWDIGRRGEGIVCSSRKVEVVLELLVLTEMRKDQIAGVKVEVAKERKTARQ